MIKMEPVLVIYFMSFILTVSIAMMNLVTGVIVESAILQANTDREVHRAYEQKRRQEMVPHVREILHHLDADESGEISLDELLNAEEDVANALQQVMKLE